MRQCYGPLPIRYRGQLSLCTPFNDGRYFNHSCNTTASPPILALGNKVEIVDITWDGELLVYYPISYRRYEPNTTVPSAEYQPFIRHKRFPLSTTKNVIGAIGCDTFVMLNGTMNNLREFHSGCMTMCASPEDVDTRTCSGIGCCLVSIPIGVGVTDVDLAVRSLDEKHLVQDFNPCNVAFLLAKDHAVNNTLPYSIKQIITRDDTYDTYYRNLKFPVVFYWSVGNKTCKSAQADKDYMCKGNSTCHDGQYLTGYTCQCNPGFEGSPYLHGCQDIDECAEGNHNLCTGKALCINTLGSYKCRCPLGYSGKGISSDPCVPDLNTANGQYKLLAGLSVVFGSNKEKERLSEKELKTLREMVVCCCNSKCRLMTVL